MSDGQMAVCTIVGIIVLVDWSGTMYPCFYCLFKGGLRRWRKSRPTYEDKRRKEEGRRKRKEEGREKEV